MRILITGSSDGLGLLAAQRLLSQGHQVVLHARNHQRGQELLNGPLLKAPGTHTVLIADLAQKDEVLSLAREANNLGPFDTVIHNAGVYVAPLEEVFAVNCLAPYILTCLIGNTGQKPQRLIYLTSTMHTGGRALLTDLEHRTSYGDSKFQILLLAKAVARAWPSVYSNAVNPGWVPTKMGGIGAPDDLEEGYATQVWLAASNEKAAQVSGKYFAHGKPSRPAAGVDDTMLQDAWIKRMEEISGVKFPG